MISIVRGYICISKINSMKLQTTTILIVLLLTACSKENNINESPIADPDVEELSVTNELVPLNDLKTGTFKDSVGGLYPNGSNKPYGTYATDLYNTCAGIVPIDTFGNASAKGKIIFISLGGSTGGKNMTALIKKTKGNLKTNPNLKMMNCNQPAQQAPLSFIANPTSTYWTHVKSILALHKSSLRQVQVIYLETDDGSITLKFPDRANIIKGLIQVSLRTLKQQMPNLKVVYVLGRTRTFSNTVTPWNTEPGPYYFGWACKWAIQDQIKKVPGTEYKGSKAVAPMLAWGFYQWADSLPRATDNFYWRYSQTKDGLHANEAGQDTLATRFQKFLLKDERAKLWYAAQ